MQPQTLSLALPDPEATAHLGKVLAECLEPGDLVLLEGDLGAGKTALARALIRTLVGDDTLDVPSPSFALVQPYEAGEQAILHADLYRLAEARDIDELGLLDDPDAIVLVEWPERAPTLRDKATVLIRFELGPGGEGRVAEVTLPAKRKLAAAARKARLIAT